MRRTQLGMAIFALGTMMADSEWLLIPISLVALGAWLMRDIIGKESEE